MVKKILKILGSFGLIATILIIFLVVALIVMRLAVKSVVEEGASNSYNTVIETVASTSQLKQ